MLNLTLHSKLIHKDVNKKRKAFFVFLYGNSRNYINTAKCLSHGKGKKYEVCSNVNTILEFRPIFHNRKVVKKREKPVVLILFLGMTFKFKGI